MTGYRVGNTLPNMKVSIFQVLQRLLVTISSLCVAASVLANEMIVPRGSSWKFHNLGQDLGGTGWQEPGYDDSGWRGPLTGPLGDNNENFVQRCASVIDIGPSGVRFPVIYFRKSFSVPNAAAYQSLILRLNRDDYALVYLNGVLLVNDGVPDPPAFAYTGGAAVAGNNETTS